MARPTSTRNRPSNSEAEELQSLEEAPPANGRTRRPRSQPAQASEMEPNPEGLPTTKKGMVDKRFKYAPGQSPRRASGKSRSERMAEIFGEPGERGWEFVSDGVDPEGRRSATGAQLKRYFVIRDKEGNEATVGRGEMIKFAGVQPPAAQRRARNTDSDLESAFDGDETEADGEGDADEEISLD